MMRIGVRDSRNSPKPIRIVVVGEKGTGKSSLIMAATTGSLHPNVPPLFPYTNLPAELFPDPVPAIIIDTSSRPEDKREILKEVKEADAIVLTLAFDRPETLDRLSEYWLPLFRELEVRVPIIAAGYKVDYNNEINIDEIMSPIMQEYREVETSIMWSSHEIIYVPWLVKCFNQELTPSQSEELRKFVQVRCPQGVNINRKGITIEGFLFLSTFLVEHGRIRTVWTILRKFGYNNDMRLVDDTIIPYSSFKRKPDQSVELTNKAISFLKNAFEVYDLDSNNNLGPYEMGYLFQAAPESPWNEAPYKNAVEETKDGELSLEAFLSLWQMMALIDPAKSLEYLVYAIFPHDPSSAIRVTRERSIDRKEQKSEREVVQCFVFGPNSSGKSALLNRFIGRSYDDDKNNGSTEERYAVNMVEKSGVIITAKTKKKTLVMKEIRFQEEDGFLLSNEALAACDVAIFLYDSSDESSWKRAIDLLADVATTSKDAGFEFPCLMVASKTDLDSFPMAIQESIRVTQDIGIEAPIPTSSKLGDFDYLFQKILTAAENPHLCIPKIESKRRRSRKLIKRSLTAVSIGTAAFVAGTASFRLYSARNQSS
ncbi:unnamed protein product [Microthlaspi erraticum]|uniref:Mitochondrial Rho GTPase n=1 Tax=Microthlaspi erraticum TaxID=1685480 RepID=A0A6D2HKF5_9BRAS|nr:unnamed protein product [Microthlaspi erraticum]